MAISKEGVYGPYEGSKPGYWRVKFIDRDGGTSSRNFKGEGALQRATEEVEKCRANLAGKTVSDGIDEYLHRETSRGLGAKTVELQGHRLRTFFQVGGGRTGGRLADVTLAQAARLLEASKIRRRRVAIRGGHANGVIKGYRDVETPRSVVYRVKMLAEVRHFVVFCRGKGYLKEDPTRHSKDPEHDLKVEGERNAGKLQLAEDEALAWEEVALTRVDAGCRRALAAYLCLILGCRANEILTRTARDFDRKNTILNIVRGKTKASKRRLRIPAHMVSRISAAKQGLGPFDLVFPSLNRHQLLRTVHELCRAARVAKVCTHSLRGLHGTIATEAGATAAIVAEAFGHADRGQTAQRHYIAPGAVSAAAQERVFQVFTGGRSS